MLRISTALAFAIAAAPALLPSQNALPPHPDDRARFTMAAGAHDLVELVNLIAQIKKRPIACPDDALDLAPERQLTLQHELRLTANDFEDVATTLLYTHGLGIVELQDSGQLTLAQLEPIDLAAETCRVSTRDPAAVLARPYRIEYVRTRHHPQAAPLLTLNMMRPMFALGNGIQFTKLQLVDGELEIAGLTPAVVAALRYLALVEQRPVATAEPLTLLPDLVIPAPGRALPLAEFVTQTSRALDANILLPDELPAVAIELAGDGPFDAKAWLREATAALAEHHLTLITLNARSRVLQLAPTRGRRADHTELFWRAEVVDLATALDPDGPTRPVMVMVGLQHITATDAANAVRPMLRRGGVTLGTAAENRGLYAVGMSHQVRPVLQRVRAIDVPK